MINKLKFLIFHDCGLKDSQLDLIPSKHSHQTNQETARKGGGVQLVTICFRYGNTTTYSLCQVQAAQGVERPLPQSGMQVSVRQGSFQKNICSMLHVISISYNILIEVGCRESAGDTDFLN